MSRIAIVGMSCRYPDARDVRELWENSVAGRRAFRRMPDQRTNLADYHDTDSTVPDTFYASHAAVIEGYEFDRVAHRVSGATYRSTDLTHWLALDVAGQALADAGFADAVGLPREQTSVIVGNSLTGEFTRASTMRLRWPYVRRTVSALLDEQGWDGHDTAAFLSELESRYKAPFADIGEDSLAGGLANTIAGRICNHFDLKGGGYTVDGACSSSLLAVATACIGLEHGDADVAVAGGVDLSLDPFELVGFAKTGALSTSEMRLYDRRSNGFWPGEGCGMIVLMREEDARAEGRSIYATITGWGVSSDGQGGMTRPEQEGYELAVARAYARAGYGVDTVAMVEGHGTGTPVGDALELRALANSRTTADPMAPPAAVGSIKALIGHTKAAAGVAGLIRATMAVHEQVLPPTVGCTDPHPQLSEDGGALRTLRRAEAWPTDQQLRAGVSSMGFGGINTHVTLESTAPRRRPSARMRALAAGIQEHELVLLDARDADELADKVKTVAQAAEPLSFAEIGDLAAHLERELSGHPFRVAVVAHGPADLQAKLQVVLARLSEGTTTHHSSDGAVRLDIARPGATATLLFPGQGGGRVAADSALRRRDEAIDRLYREQGADPSADFTATETAQPHIVVGHLAGLRALGSVGLTASQTVGHSLGELTALHWAGALAQDTLLQAVRARGAAMAAGPEGAMAVLRAETTQISDLLDDGVVVTGYNASDLQVVGGTSAAIDALLVRARARGVDGTRLEVRRAFHSPWVADAAADFRAVLDTLEVDRPSGTVISTCTGEQIPPTADLRALLTQQITSPVRFAQAVATVTPSTDVFVEVGPGRVCTGLVAETGVPRVALDTDDDSLQSLLQVVGAAFATGVEVDTSSLFVGRLLKAIEPGRALSFFTNPCETAPATRSLPPVETAAGPQEVAEVAAGADENPDNQALEAMDVDRVPAASDADPLQVVRRLVARRVELPESLVRDDTHLLDELHLSSITIGQLANDAAREFGVELAQGATNFATATVAALAEALATAGSTTSAGQQAGPAETARGAAPWARPFAVVRTPRTGAVPVVSPTGSRAEWGLFDPHSTPGAESLRRRLESAGTGDGVLVVSTADPASWPEASVLSELQTLIAGARRIVLVQHGPGLAGLVKSVWQEDPTRQATVVHVDDATCLTDERVADVVAAEVSVTDGFHEVVVAADRSLSVPELAAVAIGEPQPVLERGDLLLVTGGGKGITAECALTLARSTGARLGILGRSDPTSDAELCDNLERMGAAGIAVDYRSADVTDPEAVGAAIADLVDSHGPVRGVLHGAGRNVPSTFESLTAEEWCATLDPKVGGLHTVLDHVADLRLLVVFGSIIGRVGLPGEAHYAVANEWLAALAEQYADAHPQCRVRCLEWSVWSGVGMGEKLDVVENLARTGITAVTPDQGVSVLTELVQDPDAPVVSVVSGRTQGIHTMGHHRPDLPLARFVERPLVHYPDAELVVEATLSADDDPYLRDHLLDDNLLFPAVMGLEAMNQVAQALTGHDRPAAFHDVALDAPIVVRPDQPTTIRIAAARLDRQSVAVAISCAETGFARDHFTARLHYTDRPAADRAVPSVGEVGELPLLPAADLYGSVLFQGRAFQRLTGFTRALARGACAALKPEQRSWFAAYQPQRLTLADPGVRDALMHGNQVSVPHATLLPVGIDEIRPAGPELPDEVGMRAVQTAREGSLFTYDIDLVDPLDPTGTALEQWRGLRLRAVAPTDHATITHPVLLGPLVSRVIEDRLGAEIECVCLPDDALGDAEADSAIEARRERTAGAATRLLGEPAKINYRPDGRPELVSENARQLSASHSGGFTLVAMSERDIGCDLQQVSGEHDWAALLGERHALAELIEPVSADEAGCLVWAAGECLVKLGLPSDAPLTISGDGNEDGWFEFSSGTVRVLTRIVALQGGASPFALSVAI